MEVVVVVLSEGLQWRGPVVWWQPVEGWRHALSPDLRPRPGQERETVCGEAVTLIDPSEADWLMPTCDACMAEALELAEQRRTQAQPGTPSDRRWWESPAQARARRLQGEP